jgi:NH3-dependent NAD+ synthetase
MMLDTAVLVMLCIATALQVQLMGINLVYLGISEGIDTAEAERMLKRQLDQAKAKADEAKQRALIAAERAKAAAQQARSASTPTLPPTAVNECPNCKSSISPEDAFCENCGHRLR